MPKTAIIVTVATVLGVVLVFLLFRGKDPAVLSPIVDPTCESGYGLVVGEGCAPLKDACEIRGDGYYFDGSQQECVVK